MKKHFSPLLNESKLFLVDFCILVPFIRDLLVSSSVTRLGDLLDFGQVFKAFGNN